MNDPVALLELFDAASAAVLAAVRKIPPAERRARTDRDGQYALDLVADAAACAVLEAAPVRIVSEESGVHERAGAPVTVVIDPVDGSTNCSRGIPYWATSICAIDADGALAALVVNQATGSRVTAIRGDGAYRDGARLHASPVRDVENAMVHLTGAPRRVLPWKQYRSLGCAALALCEVAAGSLDGNLDGGPWHAPWDYLGGYLACIEAGAVVYDAGGQPLVATDVDARRQVVAAGTKELADALLEAAT